MNRPDAAPTPTTPIGSHSARFDDGLHAWILSRYDDVDAALREPDLVPGDAGEAGDAHAVVRRAVAHSLAPARLAALRPGFERAAREHASRLPTDRSIDLLDAYAAPLSLDIAVAATGAPEDEAPRLAALARDLFLAAAMRSGGDPGPAAGKAAAELARRLLHDDATIHVQTFVALARTLPHFLAGAWLELLGNEPAMRRLRDDSAAVPAAIDELLRIAGPSRAVFRHARRDLRIGGVRIAAGEGVILALDAANHDPGRFAEPCTIDLDRDARAHLAFAGGAHACSGAPLVRMAAAIATRALLEAADSIELAGPVDWIDGFAIRAPASLPAVLRRRPPRP